MGSCVGSGAVASVGAPVSTFPFTAGDVPQNVVQGIAPPHSIEAEQSLLGAVLLSDKPMYQYVVSDNLQPEDFYRDRHRLIFASMLDLWRDNEPIDVLTVTEHLRARGKLEEAGGQGEIDVLTSFTPSIGAIRAYAKIVKERSLLRRVLTTTYEIQASVHAHDLEPRDIVEHAERAILEVAHDDTTKDFREVRNVLDDEVRRWHMLSTEGVTMTGTPSGFADLDEITGGFQPGNLVIVAARPSMGKSALVTNFAENVALHPDPERRKAVALFSLEMSESELAQRFVASQASIKGDDLRKGRLKDERKWKRVLECAGRFDQAPLFIDDSSDISMLEIRAKARRLHQQQPLGMVIVDYLQLLRPDGRTDNRVEQVGQMSRGLKILARELEVPVVALSQLSRGVESRNDKRPLLSDLRESGQIEQDADLVMFIYRDEYYNRETTDALGEAELIIAKHRNGSLGTVELMFQGEYPRFLTKAREAAY
jgi:replicative DNA helicase